MTTIDELMKEVGEPSTRFKPKMTHHKRCQVLALHHLGVARVVISSMFGIDPRTVSHVASDSSPHYKSVRKELKGMGKEDFIGTYVDDELLEMVREAKGNFPTASVAVEAKNSNAPNKTASRMAGVHRVKPEQCEREHQVEIAWIDPDTTDGAVEVAGWYYRDMSSDMPDTWFAGGDEDSLRTSKTCYDSMLMNLMD